VLMEETWTDAEYGSNLIFTSVSPGRSDSLGRWPCTALAGVGASTGC
jgi:hypothetical protein